MQNINFYDIESLSNVFSLANYLEKENILELYYLVDTPELITDQQEFMQCVSDRIYQKNHNFDGEIYFYDLRLEPSNRHLAQTFGLSNARPVNDPGQVSDYDPAFRITCDSDYGYNQDIHPFFAGYNSFNYDTTILSIYFQEVFQLLTFDPDEDQPKTTNRRYVMSFLPTTARFMRDHNDIMFNQYKDRMPDYLLYMQSVQQGERYLRPNYECNAYLIRKNMIMSGRHIDVARLNEKQRKVGLKRLLGLMGYQILESNMLKTGQDTIENKAQLYDLLAYNVSDVVNLAKLFKHKLYQSQFALKQGLLTKYPELVYQQKRDEYKPDISPQTVRYDRLMIDSSSAQFATKSLCPYGHLKDMETVSFLYPHADIAREMNIPQVDVLEEARKFFEKLFPDKNGKHKESWSYFDKVYNYYASLRGKNFNTSDNYREDFAPNPMPSMKLSQFDMDFDGCMPYFDKDGRPTSCFVTFSTGGIHGAEYNIACYKADMEAYNEQVRDMEYVQSVYPNPVDLRKAKTITMPDGTERPYKHFLKSGLTIPKSQYKELADKKPQLFKTSKKGTTMLNKDYTYTSCGLCNHEDFKSYYPNLLRMMKAFFNEGLGYDRYAEMFYQKEEYGRYAKDESSPQEKRDYYETARSGVKLVLNSASGAGDTDFNSNIRMNNTIISMRIIGQLFSWRIGQAQAYQGAAMISTNTDGLYSVMEATLNNQILEKEAADIGVEIEPEPLFLISKDTNNRLELNPSSGDVISASGGTLGCRKGPNPEKSLAHPAIIDWALAEYLIVAAQGYKGLSLDKPFDEAIGRNILNSEHKFKNFFEWLRMFQNVIASSPGSVNYIYGFSDEDPDNPIILPHYNRVFIMKDNTPGTIHLNAATVAAITPAKTRKRAREGLSSPQKEPTAVYILQKNGVDDLPRDKDIILKKVTGIEPSWYMFIQNKDLSDLSEEEGRFLRENIDMEKYLKLLRDGYENNWRNKLPGELRTSQETPDEDSEMDLQIIS